MMNDVGFESMFFDRDGQPISSLEFGRLNKDMKYKRVDETYIGPYRVSTVWLGLDHGHGGKMRIFETMVFLQSGDPEYDAFTSVLEADYSAWSELDAQRYETEAEARAGHAAMVEKWRHGGVE